MKSKLFKVKKLIAVFVAMTFIMSFLPAREVRAEEALLPEDALYTEEQGFYEDDFYYEEDVVEDVVEETPYEPEENPEVFEEPEEDAEDLDLSVEGSDLVEGFAWDSWEETAPFEAAEFAGRAPRFLPPSANPATAGNWGATIWEKVSEFYGYIDPNDFVSVGDKVRYGFTIRGVAGHNIIEDNRIRSFVSSSSYKLKLGDDVTHLITLNGNKNESIRDLGLAARITKLETIPNAMGSNNALDMAIEIEGVLEQAFSGSLGFFIPTATFGGHGQFIRLNNNDGEPGGEWLVDAYKVWPKITVEGGRGVAIEGYLGGELSQEFTIKVDGAGGFNEIFADKDVTSWISSHNLGTYGLKLEIVERVASEATSARVRVSTIDDGGAKATISPKEELEFKFPVSTFRLFNSEVIWSDPEDAPEEIKSTIEILEKSAAVPYISEFSGPKANNNQRVFEIGEKIDRITGNSGQNLRVVVEFNGRLLKNGFAPDQLLAGWKLQGGIVDIDDDGVASIRADSLVNIFEDEVEFYSISGVSNVPGVPNSGSINIAIEGTVKQGLNDVRNWTDLVVVIPASTFVGEDMNPTYVIGRLASNVPPTTNPPRTMVRYAITEDGKDPQRGVTSTGVTIKGNVSSNLANNFNDTFRIGLGTAFELRRDVRDLDIISWFPGAPSGIKAKVVGGGNIGDPDVTVRFEDVPDSTKINAPIIISVPANNLTDLKTGRQAGSSFAPESINNFWNIEPALDRKAEVSNVTVSGMVGGQLDEESFTMTITLTGNAFTRILNGTHIGGDTNGNPLFYRKDSNDNFVPLDLDDYNISATIKNHVEQGAKTATVEFRRLDELKNPEGTLPKLLVEPIYIGFKAAHLENGIRYVGDTNEVVLYSELNEKAVFDVQNTGMSDYIHGFAGNPIRGSETSGTFVLTLPIHPTNDPDTNPTVFRNLTTSVDPTAWFGDSLPKDPNDPSRTVPTVRIFGINGNKVTLSFMGGDVVTTAFNKFAKVTVPAQYVSTNEDTRIRNLDTYVSVAAAEVGDTEISGIAGSLMSPTDIYIVMHGLKPASTTVEDSWFKKPDGAPFFDPKLPPSGLSYKITTDTINLGTELDRNDVYEMTIEVSGTPSRSFSGPFVLNIPGAAFTGYVAPENPNGSDAIPEYNTEYTFPNVSLSGATVKSNANPKAVFDISQEDFTGTVTLNVTNRDLPGGAGVYRTVTVTTTNNVTEDIWLLVSGTISNTTHKFTELVKIPKDIRKIEHDITVSSPSDIVLSVIRRTNTTDHMPNIAAGNYRLVPLTPGPIERPIRMVP